MRYLETEMSSRNAVLWGRAEFEKCGIFGTKLSSIFAEGEEFEILFVMRASWEIFTVYCTY